MAKNGNNTEVKEQKIIHQMNRIIVWIILGIVILYIIEKGNFECSCFFIDNKHYVNNKTKLHKIYVSKPAQKKSNQLKTKIIINKRKKEENERNKAYKNEFKSSSKYKIIEELIEDYPIKLPLLYNIEKEPFMILKDKIKKEFLKGYELPFNFIHPVKYELLKIIGKISDPFKPICSHSLTPKLFISKLFGNAPEITYADFCYKLEYKFKFYMPSYTQIFKFEKELLWKQWVEIRELKEVSPVTSPENHDRIYKILENDETTLPITIRRVNKEINSQGIHPSILRMFFDFLNIAKSGNIIITNENSDLFTKISKNNKYNDENDDILKRSYAFLKLESIKNEIKNRDYLEGIRPDYLYIILNKKAEEYYNNFNEKEYDKAYKEAVNYNKMRQNMISENSEYKKQRKLFSEQTKKSLMKFYDIQLPTYFKKYMEKKKENYKIIQSKIKKMIDNKYLKRKQKRENILSGKISPISANHQKDAGTDEKKKRKKKKKK
ncbi:conserved Plasmodium protein, unknown function [Plasmodium berghei]|uniref:Uncharacterized protein n=2 Tax=Plasmodium berghei TaxID=5821 RepID=A0A509AFA1_PLABA|nr:conserved protein, unknown function [Plasmodium berghei ANKA]CXI19491.1 conserved Plasmodium protein, unknown function [Plasmodium berghei]SCM19854.1 conserved Plasmodium protein, unknown function [Plasmodium berghei]SCN23590.1 conserved Plasmodium protein, unknown function [Plasmodium berghei]SCO59938.1 conserved Plasmodium protein, unknown function [Plasmodium berghei]VUC54848.1 conserved protein, unknown function [Plasmodium berghei ANKA]|eukprot:XP_034420673.1 conserved protein, unknown function [Plasmodium berghei ANKA]